MTNKFSIREHVDSSFKDHVCVAAPSKSYAFYGHSVEKRYLPATTRERAAMSRSSAYSFEITWRPGHIILTGDLGELTLVQKNAMPTFEAALKWVVDADYDYLMGKTNVKKVYDAEETFEYLMETANREAVDTLIGHQTWSYQDKRYYRKGGIRADIRRYRRECAEAVKEFEAALKAWDIEKDMDNAPILEDFMPYKEEFDAILRSRDWKDNLPKPKDVDAVIRHVWEICGYETWVSYWKALEVSGWYAADVEIDNPDMHPTYVLNPENRRQIKEKIRAICDQQYELCDFLHEAGFDDYSGNYIYPHQTKMQIDAIKHGCSVLFNQMKSVEEKAA